MSSTLRLGIIGIGNMGGAHAGNIRSGQVKRCTIAAVCDTDPARLKGLDCPVFADHRAMLASGTVDAVLIATPHYDHTTIGIDALAAGVHVMVEKPLSVHKADCERLIAAYERRPKPGQLFAAMFNQRTNPAYIKLRDLIQAGELGEIRRVNWIITDWFRTEAYYASGGWRATWRGEGGGVLINQCPHQLDLMQWLFGMPVRVRAHVALGKWHAIETEDAVTAYLEYATGATGVFITTTGETPGTNRLEVAGERGRVVIEGEGLKWIRNTTPMTEFSRTTTQSFGRPETWNVEIPVKGSGGQHIEVLQNFVDAILDGKPLIAPAQEGIRSVELGNAMLVSGLLDRTVELPLDSAMVEREFQRLIASSKFEKKVVAAGPAGDFAASHSR